MRLFNFALLIGGVFVSLISQAQTDAEHQHHHNWCGKNHALETLLEAHPEQVMHMMEARETLEAFTAEYENSGERDGQTLTVPVVFHIIHMGGPENISDAQVHSAIDMLNEDFSATNPELPSVNAPFQGIIGNANIQFALAKRDPNGNCTNGIVRVANQATFNGGIQSLSGASPHWPRNRYLNVYVCDQFPSPGLLGFTLIPSSVDGPQGTNWDGIYIRHPWIGRVGTSAGYAIHALSHEVGHWINLEHTWGMWGDAGDPANCNDDDMVNDTPNTIGYTNCNNPNASSCGSVDNVENFMDYAFCEKMFTQGQVSRMRAALLSPIAQRNQLHTTSNLQFTGLIGNQPICEARFEVVGNKPSMCPGTEVSFMDLSYHDVTSRTWSFPGGSPSTSSEANPTVLYNTPGVYNVTLTVSNGSNSESVTRDGIIIVNSPGVNPAPFSESFESFSTLHGENFWSAFDPDGELTRSWELSENVGYSGNKSAMVRGRFNANGATEWLESPTIDLSNVSGNNAVLSFKYAHARRNNNTDDQLRVWISRDCGESWNLRRTITMPDLPTVSNAVSGTFTPTSQDQWQEVVITTLTSIFLNESFKVRFEFTSINGNNIYIDDINIFDPNTLNAESVLFNSTMELYPNPAQTEVTLSYYLDAQAQVQAEIIDVSGAVVDAFLSAARGAGEHLQPFSVNHLAPGLYFIRLSANGQVAVKKLVVQ